MFLLGILVAVVAMAVIRTQQVLPTSHTKDSAGITYKSYKNQVSFNNKTEICNKEDSCQCFLFQCFPRNNAEEQQLGEETQDTEEPLNRTMADF